MNDKFKNEIASAVFVTGGTLNVEVDMAKVQTEPDGSVIVGEPNAPICINGDALLEILTTRGVRLVVCEECKCCWNYMACENGCFGNTEPCEHYMVD